MIRWIKASFAIAAVLFVSGCLHSASTDWNVQTGDPVPKFSLQNVNGGGTVSNETLAGKPYVMSIFATWCPPCREELLALNEVVWKPLEDKGVNVVAVNFGEEDDATIKRFIDQNGLQFPVLADMSGALRKELGVQMVPQALVVGPDGTIIDLHVGVTEETIESISKELQAALEE